VLEKWAVIYMDSYGFVRDGLAYDIQHNDYITVPVVTYLACSWTGIGS
jgi:hypothetical protein